jgi:hypothetical protein
MLANAGRSDDTCNIDPFAAKVDTSFARGKVRSVEVAAGQTEVNDMRMGLLDCTPERVKIRRIRRAEVITQGVDVVDSKFRSDYSRKLGQVHAWLAAISAVIGGTFYISSKGPGGYSQPVSRFDGKVKLGLMLRFLSRDEKRSADREEGRTCQEMTAS